MAKYIDAERLRKEVKRNEKAAHKSALGCADSETRKFHEGKDFAYQYVGILIDSLQQDSIKVYRVENEKEQKGLWRKFDGTWEPLFDMLTDGQCKDMPMDDSPIYREGGKHWFASAPSKETLQKWFSKRDLEELTAAGFTITEFEVLEYKILSEFEYIFTRESIISKANLTVSDIYPHDELGTSKKEGFPILAEFMEKASEIGKKYNYGFGPNLPQPKVDVIKALDDYYKKVDWSPAEAIEYDNHLDIARHFYELGLRRAAEMYYGIEYNRQREEEEK